MDKICIFRHDFKEKIGHFDRESVGEIRLSHDELLQLARGGGTYRVCDDHLYFCFSSEVRGAYFFLLKTQKGFDLEQFDRDFEVLIFALNNAYDCVKRYQSAKKMSSLAHTDDVTGLYNQRRLLQDIDRNMGKANRKKGHFSLVFLDIDKFKDVNDEYGHIIGSKLLIQVAGVIRQVIRETDYIYRYGGDEFVIILPQVKIADAKKIGERLLNRMKRQHFVAGSDQKFKLGLSLGVAEYPRDAGSREEILAMADKMMYQAKRTGRGKICVMGERGRGKRPS